MFEAVRAHLPEHVATVVSVAPEMSKGVIPRVRSTLAARRARGDVHHVTGDTTFMGLLLPRRQTVLTVHDCEFLDRASWLKGLVYRVLWLQLPCLRATVVTVVSPATADHLIRSIWVAPKDLRIVPDPLPDGFEASPAPQNDPPVVLQIGTRPNKGLPAVVRAVEGTGWRLRTVGVLDDGQRALLADSDVPHEGLRDLTQAQVAEAYAGSDVLVVASSREGFGMHVVEAQACARPVVVADREPLPWVAGPGGAVKVDPTDPESIRDGIATALFDAPVRDGLVAAGLANVHRFDADRVAQAYAAIYDEVAARLR